MSATAQTTPMRAEPVRPRPAQPCPCASGLRFVRCCGLDLASLPAADASRHLLPLAERAKQAAAKGVAEMAERLSLELLELSPGHIETLWLLSRIRLAQGTLSAAEALVRRIVTLNPNGLVATQDLALRLMQRGALDEATFHARNAVRLNPADPLSHNLLAMILTEAHQPRTGEFHYRRVLTLTGERDPIVLANLAWALKLQGRVEEARALYEESTAARPEVPQTLLGWAQLEEVDRDFARAAELLDHAEALAPDNPSVHLSRAVVHSRTGDHAAALAVLDGIAARRTGGQLGPEELLQKGRLLDRMGRHDDAWTAWTDGKALARQMSGLEYQADAARDLAARLQRLFTADRLQSLPDAGVRDDVAQPVFILGFPRSGTTLVEQMLTAHPQVAAGDELPFIGELTLLMPRLLTSPLSYPEALAELWMGDRCEGLDLLRDHYLTRVRQAGVPTPTGAWFTDKMPLNEFHLGLIGLVFPAAPLIHVIRHPLDIMVSAVSNHFTHGFGCGFALDTAARHYALTAELVAHYRAEMPLRYLPVRYEDILADQEGQVRRMLDFIGLPFDPACVQPHENRRYARTASYAQVTEKLYHRSRERWRHYQTQLEPVIPVLQPAMDRLGYVAD